MTKHEGLIGGLDRSGATGQIAPYFADFNKEIIFHVATLMPNAASQDSASSKRNIIGNRSVFNVA